MIHSSTIKHELLDKKLDEIFSDIEKPEMDLDNISEPFNVDEYIEYVNDNGLLDKEVIYYSTAMEYLSKNDPSLQKSMEYASEIGCKTKNLNSELLASIHKSETAKEDFYEKRGELEEAFKEVNNIDHIIMIIYQIEGSNYMESFVDLEEDTTYDFIQYCGVAETLPTEIYYNENDADLLYSKEEPDGTETYLLEYTDTEVQYLITVRPGQRVTWSVQ